MVSDTSCSKQIKKEFQIKPLEKFKSTSPPLKKVSKIQKFKIEVLELYSEHYSVFQIQDFLLQNGVKISTRRIYQFLNKILKNPNFSLKTPSAVGGQNSQNMASDGQIKSSKATNAFMRKLEKISKDDQ